MSKIRSLILLLPALLTASCSAPNTALGKDQNRADESVSLTSAQLTKLKNFFDGAYRVESDVDLSYIGGSLKVTDEVSDSARYTSVSTVTEKGTEFVGSTSVLKAEDGSSESVTIGIDNTAVHTPLIDYADDNYTQIDVDFEEEFGSPFDYLTGLDSSTFNKRFTVTQDGEGYTITPDAIALGKLSNPLLTFFPLHDGASWDYQTGSENLLSLSIDLASDGTPTSMEFVTSASDRFGMTVETYTSTLTAIDTVKGVDLYPEQSDEAHTKLANALSALKTSLSGGNFTQHIRIDVPSLGGYLQYDNYYDLKEGESLGDGLMISSYPLSDANYGETYTGVVFAPSAEAGAGYYVIGISPDSDYYATIDPNPYTKDEVIPQIGSISKDFFSYDAATSTYTFDLTDPRVNSSSFCVLILEALFGYGDGLSAMVPTYTSDLNTYDYTFHTLTVTLDDQGSFESAALNFDSASFGPSVVNAISTVTFNNVGNTDLSQIDALKDIIATIR